MTKQVEFVPSGVRRIAVDYLANIYEVTSMFDRLGHETSDPALASTCVVRCGDNFVVQDCDDVPVYTVH